VTIVADDSTDKNAGDGLTPIVSVRPQNADDPNCKYAVNEQNDMRKVAEDEPRRKKLIHVGEIGHSDSIGIRYVERSTPADPTADASRTGIVSDDGNL